MVQDRDGERCGRLPGVWDQGGRARPPQGPGPGFAGVRAVGHIGAGEADLALPRPGLRERKTWTEQHPAIGSRQALSERARFEICRLVGADEWSVARAARAFGVGWHCAWSAVVDHGRPLVDDPARMMRVSSFGVDETQFLSGTRNRATVYVTGLVDLDRRLLLDVAIGRSGRVVTDWLEAQPLEWRRFVSVAAIDAFRGYATGIGACLDARAGLGPVPRRAPGQPGRRRRAPSHPARDAPPSGSQG
jgi:hypothetical protein